MLKLLSCIIMYAILSMFVCMICFLRSTISLPSSYGWHVACLVLSTTIADMNLPYGVAVWDARLDLTESEVDRRVLSSRKVYLVLEVAKSLMWSLIVLRVDLLIFGRRALEPSM